MIIDVILGLGLSLPVATSVPIAVVTGVAQGVSEQKKQNAEQATRMLKFHVDVQVPVHVSEKRSLELSNCIITLHNDKLWVEHNETALTPKQAGHHPFTGFYIEYPDDNRMYTRGLVSTISVDPPMLNWIYVDKDTFEVKYSNRTGSIAHRVGSFDWTTDKDENSHITLDDWEGFVALEESPGQWALYFDFHDDGLKQQKKGRRTIEVNLLRRVIPAQETNKWGFKEEGNIGFRSTEEVNKLRKPQRCTDDPSS